MRVDARHYALSVLGYEAPPPQERYIEEYKALCSDTTRRLRGIPLYKIVDGDLFPARAVWVLKASFPWRTPRKAE